MSKSKVIKGLTFTKTVRNTTPTKQTHKKEQNLRFNKTGKITRHSTLTIDHTKNSRGPKEVRMSMSTCLLA